MIDTSQVRKRDQLTDEYSMKYPLFIYMARIETHALSYEHYYSNQQYLHNVDHHVMHTLTWYLPIKNQPAIFKLRYR